MLFNQPPGYNPISPNKQSLGVLATPGIQSQPTSLGFNPSGSPFQQGGYKPGTSGFIQPSSSTPGSGNQMNQYFDSRNISSLLRALVGNTTTNTSKI